MSSQISRKSSEMQQFTFYLISSLIKYVEGRNKIIYWLQKILSDFFSIYQNHSLTNVKVFPSQWMHFMPKQT